MAVEIYPSEDSIQTAQAIQRRMENTAFKRAAFRRCAGEPHRIKTGGSMNKQETRGYGPSKTERSYRRVNGRFGEWVGEIVFLRECWVTRGHH